MDILSTERMLLKEFDASHAQNFYDLNIDPDVVKYTGDVAFKSVDEAKSFIEAYPDYKKVGYGRWACHLHSNGKFVGWCGIKKLEDDTVDLGYRFFQAEWGKGYATESAAACLKYAIINLGIEEILGKAVPVNIASVKVLQKLGMTKVGQEDYQQLTFDVYKITRAEYLALNET